MRGKKTLFVAAAGAAGIIVSKPQTTSSALLRVFDLQRCDWEPKFTINVFIIENTLIFLYY